MSGSYGAGGSMAQGKRMVRLKVVLNLIIKRLYHLEAGANAFKFSDIRINGTN